jgi:hypothetical protein
VVVMDEGGCGVGVGVGLVCSRGGTGCIKCSSSFLPYIQTGDRHIQPLSPQHMRNPPAQTTRPRPPLTISLLPLILESTSSRESGTVTMPTLGSMVQKGKLAAAALPFSTIALKRVDCRAAAVGGWRLACGCCWRGGWEAGVVWHEWGRLLAARGGVQHI